MSKESEKIVNLNEDSKSHSHDNDSYQKLMKQQEMAKKSIDNQSDKK